VAEVHKWRIMITVNNRNEVYLQIDTDAGILLELNDFFTFTVPGAQFTPQYRAKLWDGKIRLLNIFSRELYMGLLPYIQDFCEKNQYQFVDNTTAHYDNIDSLESFIADLDFQSNGKSIEMRDYQLDAVKTALTRNRTLLLSPTASGKSLIIYTIMRWHQAQNRKQLIIVPTTSLVEQLYGDFNDYASTTDWNAADHCAKIYSGKEKITSNSIYISTWQSIYKMPKSYFEQFDVVYGDEAHLFKSKSLTAILHKCINATHRVGTTGTLDGTKTHRLVLEGLFGVVHRVTTTKKLMDTNQLAQLKITCVQLNYSDEEKKLTKNFSY
jgi:superfamily II DNA or RNA helicase